MEAAAGQGAGAAGTSTAPGLMALAALAAEGGVDGCELPPQFEEEILTSDSSSSGSDAVGSGSDEDEVEEVSGQQQQQVCG